MWKKQRKIVEFQQLKNYKIFCILFEEHKMGGEIKLEITRESSFSFFKKKVKINLKLKTKLNFYNKIKNVCYN